MTLLEMHHRVRSFVVAGLVLGVGACGGGSGAGGGGSGFRAKIDGQAWEASPISIAAGPILSLSGAMLVVGSESKGGKNTGLTITLNDITGPGTYALGVGSGVYGGTASVGESTDGSGNANVWQTPLDGVSGTFTIATLTATHLTATFEYVTAADDRNDIGGTRAVTEGGIDLPFDGALEPSARERGGRSAPPWAARPTTPGQSTARSWISPAAPA